MRAGKQNYKRFSLIELLIVISVIAIIAGLFLPVLSAAREKGRAISCTNNFSQCMKGQQLYAGDFNDMIVYTIAANGGMLPWGRCWTDTNIWRRNQCSVRQSNHRIAIGGHAA